MGKGRLNFVSTIERGDTRVYGRGERRLGSLWKRGWEGRKERGEMIGDRGV